MKIKERFSKQVLYITLFFSFVFPITVFAEKDFFLVNKMVYNALLMGLYGVYVLRLRLKITPIDIMIVMFMMVGRTLEDIYSIKRHKGQNVVLEVRGLTKEPRFRDISFELHQGEILGMFGLVGSGRTDVVRAIFGATKPDAGEITINGKRHNPESPRDGINMGVGFLPEDRKLQGLALKLSVQDNINLVVYPQIAKLGIIDGDEKKNRALRYIDELRIRTPSMVQRVDRLSGGNQQKVVVSKWLNAESEIFIFDEPTTGVDVGAKMEIYKIFEALTARGASIILISSYLPEVLGLADRILVMHEGNLAGIVGNDATEEEIMRLASGLDRKGTKEERV